jgi:type VI secretion system protein ImpH
VGEPRPPQARHGFLPAVLYLERMLRKSVRVGENGPLAEEGIRFQHDPTLQFSASDVREIVKRTVVAEDDRESEHYLLTTTFLGLTGGISPLPDYIADEVATEDPDVSLRRRFLDIFHHRLVSLLYRGIVKYHYPSEFATGGRDVWSRRILCLTGIDAFSDPPPDATHWPQWLRLSPLLVAARRGSRTLRLALEDELARDIGDAAISIEEFIGDWVEIDDRQLFRMGVSANVLGQDAILGRRIFDRSAKFRVHIRPITHAVLRGFQGEGELRKRLDRIVRSVLHEPFDYEVALDLADGHAPGMRLSRQRGHSLGQDAWLGKRAKLETRVVLPAISKV